MYFSCYRLLTGKFYQKFDKIDHKSTHTNINLVKVIKLAQEIIEISIISIHPPVVILKSPSTYIVYRQFTAFFVIWQNFAKFPIKFIDIQVQSAAVE